MTWQRPLPLIATVVGAQELQADAAIGMFESLARFGGRMAGAERVAYFRGDIGAGHAERLAQLGVALKVLDAATDVNVQAPSISALLDSAEPGFLLVLAPESVVTGDFAEWVDQGAISARTDTRGLAPDLLQRLLGSDRAPVPPLYDPAVLLIRRDIAAEFGARWDAAVREVLHGVRDQAKATGAEAGVAALGLSLAIARGAMEVVALPAAFPVVAPGQDAHSAGPSRDSAIAPVAPPDLTEIGRHMTPHFDNQSFWNERYRTDPQRGSGVGSRGAPRALKESLIRRAIEESGASSILDVGCGDLASVEQLGVSRYVGIDISDEVVQANSHKRPDWTFLCGDFVQLYDRERFESDLVLCFDVLIHQHDFTSYEAFVRRLVLSCRGSGLVGAFQTPPRAPYRSQITAYHEPITCTLARMGATGIEVIASYRDTVVARFHAAAKPDRPDAGQSGSG